MKVLFPASLATITISHSDGYTGRHGIMGQRHSNAPSKISNGFPRILSGAAMAASQQPHLLLHLVLDLPIIHSSSINKSKSAAEI